MFFEFGLKDIIDILAVALMLYYIYRLMRDSRSLNVFIGILVFVVIWIIVSLMLEMRLLGTILDKLVSVGVIALIVLLLFGGKKIPELMKGLGEGVKSFKDGMKEVTDEIDASGEELKN